MAILSQTATVTVKILAQVGDGDPNLLATAVVPVGIGQDEDIQIDQHAFRLAMASALRKGADELESS